MKMPSGWVNAGIKKEVKAKLDMSAEVAGQGLCPECKKPMTKMLANGHEVVVCHEDRIALPLKDD